MGNILASSGVLMMGIGVLLAGAGLFLWGLRTYLKPKTDADDLDGDLLHDRAGKPSLVNMKR
ncbi:hypothetical protein [Rhizobium sp. L1K21]|uniref:hypothetical protein n=1 Tax=Rhizobium sp. L1K21 TaxID=2954933 RepID=UPI002092BF26|nr:hypothetical protein [Rhizobium sp. L1K21]MCO6186532.1 hypothetical protein [Rhizobium sp. L1K21]